MAQLSDDFDLAAYQNRLRRQWSGPAGEKARPYVDKFWDRLRRDLTISGRVEGNHGVYTVSIIVGSEAVISRCSCYIGKGGYCHHCAALAYTFLAKPESFTVVEKKSITAVQTLSNLDDLSDHLAGISLEELISQLKKAGITQKAFAESIGMSTQHLSAVKRAEQRNHTFHELGATKLACLWVLERFGKQE